MGRVLLCGVSIGLARRPAAEQEYAGDNRESGDYEDGYKQGRVGSSARGGEQRKYRPMYRLCWCSCLLRLVIAGAEVYKSVDIALHGAVDEVAVLPV